MRHNRYRDYSCSKNTTVNYTYNQKEPISILMQHSKARHREVTNGDKINKRREKSPER